MSKPIVEMLKKRLNTVFDADGDNTVQAVKTSAGQLYGLEITNTNAVDAYVQFFDAATGDVTVGTTTPKLSFLVPAANTSTTIAGATTKHFDDPVGFDVAITYACTTTATGSTDPTIGLICNFLYQ